MSSALDFPVLFTAAAGLGVNMVQQTPRQSVKDANRVHSFKGVTKQSFVVPKMSVVEYAKPKTAQPLKIMVDKQNKFKQVSFFQKECDNQMVLAIGSGRVMQSGGPAGGGTLPMPGQEAPAMPDAVNKAYEKIFGKKANAIPGGPGPGSGGDDDQPGLVEELLDKLTGKHAAKEADKAERKEKLDKIFGKNPTRDQNLKFENVDIEAFQKFTQENDAPLHQAMFQFEAAQKIFFKINQNVESAIFDNHIDQKFAMA